MYFYYRSLGTWLALESTTSYSNASFIPIRYNNVTFDYDNGSSVKWTYSSRTDSFCYLSTVYPTSKSLWSVTDMYGNGYRYGYPALLTSKNEIRGFTALSTTTISGKYRVPTAVANGCSYGFSTIKVKCYFNNEYYDYLAFTTGKDFSASGYQEEGFGSDYRAVGFIKEDSPETLSLHIRTDWSRYTGDIIDFGETPQEVPTFFKAFFDNNFDFIYPYSYTIKDYEGQNILAEITEKPAVKKVELTTLANQKTLKLTYVNNDYTELEWVSETPEGKAFVGLATSPNSNKPFIGVNESLDVSLTGDIILYEAYGKYRPPATTFEVNLYQNSSEPNRVEKTSYLTSVGTLLGILREQCSILTPIITIEYKKFPDFNYVHIPIFNRYYFVTEIVSIRQNLWEIHLDVDLLMTYRQGIWGLYGFIDRNEFRYDDDIIDNKRVVEQGYDTEEFCIPNSVFTTDEGSYILNAFGCKTYEVVEEGE